MTIKVNDQYINLKTGETISVTKVDGHRTEVVTLTTTGARINPRPIPIKSLKATTRTTRGDFLTVGYVAVKALTEDHPLSPNRETDLLNDSLLAQAKMSDEELFAHANACKARMELAKNTYEKARMELAKRTSEPGVRIQGDIAVEAVPTRRISEALAREKLTPAQLHQVTIPKVDSDLVKTKLGKEVYDEVCKIYGWTIKVREATDEDFRNHYFQSGVAAGDAERIPLEDLGI